MIGWILLSREAVGRAEAALFDKEIGVLDEVGFLSLHQRLADRFFPGTSVLHTRLRYILFVPWLMEKVASKGGRDILERFTDAETNLVHQLKQGKDSESGIIGGRAYPRPVAQTPSVSYWTALGTWGVLRRKEDGSYPRRTEILRRLAKQQSPQGVWTHDNDELSTQDEASSPFVALPKPPDGFGIRNESLDFNLKRSERTFIRNHLIGLKRPNSDSLSLLARLVKEGVGHEADFAWAPEIAKVADSEDRIALKAAEHVAALACIGRAVYSALVEISCEKDHLPTSSIHRDRLQVVIHHYGRLARRFDMKRLNNLLPKLSNDLLDILRSTNDWLKNGNTSPKSLLSVYASAEGNRKGPRARLTDTVAARQRRAEWEPDEHPLARPLHYRWSNVRRLLDDLQQS